MEQGYSCGNFYTEQSFNLFGNCNSLIFGDNASLYRDLTGYNDCYTGLFSGCIGLRNVSPNFLPATTLAEYCYSNMFDGCESLVNTPELPSTTLVDGCYQYMFSNCTSLVSAPELPATTLTTDCYYKMFFGCALLNYIKALFTTKPSYTFTGEWVKGVSSTGIFVKSRSASWNVTGASGIPTGWTVQTV